MQRERSVIGSLHRVVHPNSLVTRNTSFSAKTTEAEPRRGQREDREHTRAGNRESKERTAVVVVLHDVGDRRHDGERYCARGTDEGGRDVSRKRVARETGQDVGVQL